MNCINGSFVKLKKYCEKQDFKGWDPFDGLNSIIFQRSPFKRWRAARLLWTQLFKRFPLNLRILGSVPQEYNPKGLALFLSGYVNIYKAGRRAEDKEKIDYLTARLKEARSRGPGNICWGYNFDWQSRAFFAPKWTPNVIVSTFAGNAFLDMYEITNDKEYLEIADSVCLFILKDLNRSFDNKGNFCFSYTPEDNSCIFNASLLASKFLARVYYFNKNTELIDAARKSVEFCCDRQNEDGSWVYGVQNNQKWIDSFHTGYNLEALYEYCKYSGDEKYLNNFEKGLKFYLSNFFLVQGTPKYYNNSVYPVDVHSTAQLIILLSKTGLLKDELALAKKVLTWTIKNMQAKEGYFYYQIKRYYKIKIPYMRWTQAWMFYGLSRYLYYKNDIAV